MDFAMQHLSGRISTWEWGLCSCSDFHTEKRKPKKKNRKNTRRIWDQVSIVLMHLCICEYQYKIVFIV